MAVRTKHHADKPLCQNTEATASKTTAPSSRQRKGFHAHAGLQRSSSVISDHLFFQVALQGALGGVDQPLWLRPGCVVHRR